MNTMFWRRCAASLVCVLLLASLLCVYPYTIVQGAGSNDLVLNKSIVSDSGNFSTSLPKEKMLDGSKDYANRAAWSSSVKSTYIIIDLGSVQSFTSAVIYPTTQIKSVTISYSNSWSSTDDTGGWPVASQFSFACTYSGVPTRKGFPKQSGRYVKVAVDSVGGGGIVEFELYNGQTAPTSLTLNQTSTPFAPNQSIALTATATGTNAYTGVKWTSNNTSVATVGNSSASNNPAGLVTMSSTPGTATIRATSLANSNIYADFTITNSTSGPALSEYSQNLDYGDALTLNPTFTVNSGIHWSSNDYEIVSVSDEQVVWNNNYVRDTQHTNTASLVALRPGTAVVTAQTTGGDVIRCTVTVGAAQALNGSRPIYPPTDTDTASIIAAADELMADYTDAAWDQLTPTGPPRLYVNSPVPGSGVSVSTSIADTFTAMWNWDPHQPDQITDSKTGVVFIHNPDGSYSYSNAPLGMDTSTLLPHYVTVKNVKGQDVTVPVWNMPSYPSSSKSTTTLVQARFDYEKVIFMDSSLVTLAKAYTYSTDAAKKSGYAKRVAATLKGLADHIPNEYVTNSNNVNGGNPMDAGTVPIDYYKGPTADGLAGLNRMSRFSDHNGYAYEIRPSFVTAYDLIYTDSALDALSPTGSALRDYIGENLFADSFYYFRDYYPVDLLVQSNLKNLQVLIAKLGTIMNRPDMIVWVNGYLNTNLEQYFKRDYMDGESIQYSSIAASTTNQLANEIPKFFDSYPAYIAKLPAIYAATNANIAIAANDTTNWRNVAYPNGYVPPDGDSDYIKTSTRSATSSFLLPAYGHVMLGGGTGDQQIQVNRNATDSANHIHKDMNAFTLFAFGQELMGDIRYVHLGRPERSFSTGITAHSTVFPTNFDATKNAYITMDLYNNQITSMANEGHAFAGGKVTLFEPGIHGIEAAEVDGAPKLDVASTYRNQRLQILNTQDPGMPYLIDLYRITGGSRHDYLLHGATDFDMTASAGGGLTLAPLSDQQFQSDNGTILSADSKTTILPYSSTYYKNMSKGSPTGNWNVTYTRDGDPQQTGLRIFMADNGGNQVYLGQSMVAVREGSTDTQQFWRPTLLVRHQDPAQSNLDSFFISVIEPFQGTPAISNIVRLPINQSGQNEAALSIQFANGRNDVVLVNMNDSGTVSTQDGQYSLTGRIGVYSSSGTTQSATMVAASGFQSPDGLLSNPDSMIIGNVLGVERTADGGSNALQVDKIFTSSESAQLSGRWLSLDFGPYTVIPSSTGVYPSAYFVDGTAAQDNHVITSQNGLGEMFQIDHVDANSSTIYLKDDPALRMAVDPTLGSQTTEINRPRRTFAGYGSFRIDLSSDK